jgi:hypothetical protein
MGFVTCWVIQEKEGVAMAKTRYAAKKVGENYVLVPQGPQQELARGLWFAGGLVTSFIGYHRGGVVGLAVTLAGAGMMWRGVTGCNPVGNLLPQHPEEKRRAPHHTPSHRHDWKDTGQMPEDPVDEAAMESFPASDPPSTVRSMP